MSGVIGEDGQQWEHCGVCGNFVTIESLSYEEPSERFKYGRDIGPCCVDLSPEQQDTISDRHRQERIAVSMRTYQLQGASVTLIPDGGIRVHRMDPEGEPTARWINQDHGNGVTSATVHPDDVHIMRAKMDRTLAASHQAEQELEDGQLTVPWDGPTSF